MALIFPEFVTQDGRSAAYTNDANVTVWPATIGGEYDLNQKGLATRASTTITRAPDATTALTVTVCLNGVLWFIPFNQTVTVPKQIYDVLTVPGSNYTVT